MRKQDADQLHVTAKLISAFVFVTLIVQSLFYLNPKFQASSHRLWLYSPVCVGPGRKPLRPVFSQRGSLSFPLSLSAPERTQEPNRNVSKCRFCGKIFKGLYYVTRHERIHTGERPYRCETCGRGFAQKGNLNAHRMIHIMNYSE